MSPVNDEGSAEIPPRSALYALPFQDIGSPFVQSLTSYIVQLADAHLVRPAVLVARLRKQAAWMERGDAKKALALMPAEVPCILGFGTIASRFAAATDALTCQNISAAGTFSHLEGIVSATQAGFVARFRQWCPACLLERTGGKRRAVAEPLAWSAACATACAVHRCSLAKVCRYCGKPQLYFSSLPTNVTCWCCNLPLFAPIEETAPADERGLWYATELGWLLEQREQLSRSPAFANLQESIRRLTKISRLTNRAFNAGLGFANDVTQRWLERGRPRLDFVLHLSFQAQLPLSSLLMEPQGIKTFEPREPEPIRGRRSLESTDIGALRAAFLAVNKTEDNSLSLSQTADLLGTSVSRLKHHFPDLCRKVSARARKILTEQRQKTAERAPALIEAAAQQLMDAGIFPSYRAVHRALPRPARTRLEVEPSLRALRTQLAASSKLRQRAGARDGKLQLQLDDAW